MKLITFNGSKDYNKLNHLPFNRNFKVRNDLTNSMNERGFIQPLNLIKTNLINGKEEIYIADGQNRAITASFLNITFYGILIDKTFNTINEIVEYVSSLNSSHKAWTADNYAESYAYLGIEDYKTLLSITQKSPYSLSTISIMLYGFRSKANIKSKIMNGTFTINELDGTNYTLQLAAKLSKIQKLTSRMILALHYVSSMKSFNEERFITQYQLNAKQIKELNLDDYTDVFSSWI
jgi:hypothetical protein